MVFKWFREKIIAAVINHFLGDYIENIDTDNLSWEVLGGVLLCSFPVMLEMAVSPEISAGYNYSTVLLRR